MALAPENTLAAFAQARALGADGIEFDVQLSRDGQIVVIHDERVDRTTNGRGRVADLTLAELKALDAGSWFDPRFSGERIPTLQETFDLIGAEMLLNIELKSMVRQAHPAGAGGDDGLAAAVVECARRNGRIASVLVSSFDFSALRRVRALDPRLRIGLLFDAPLDDTSVADLKAEAVHPRWSLVTEQLVEQAHARGQQVNVWTVNEPDAMRRMAALGVDAIMTNFPHVLKTVLAFTR